jgi:hypothetical protein
MAYAPDIEALALSALTLDPPPRTLAPPPVTPLLAGTVSENDVAVGLGAPRFGIGVEATIAACCGDDAAVGGCGAVGFVAMAWGLQAWG